jgi:HEAT repeat protein
MAVAAAAACLLAASAAHDVRPPSAVVNLAAEPGALAARFERALTQAAKASPDRAFWVGYSIERLQGEHSSIGSHWSGDKVRRLTVADILAGRTAPGPASPEDIRGAASAALARIENEGKPEKQVLKELGFFLKYDPGRPVVLSEAGMSNLDLSFDFEGAPLYWLGQAPEDQSLALVRDLYGRNGTEKVREHLIAAAGCHGTPKLVLPFLESVLSGPGADDLRKDAAFWIGQQTDPESLRILAKAARSDRSQEVREGAVFAISELDLPEAVDELIALARGAERKDVRKQAVFWLSQIATKKSGPVLAEIAAGDADLEIQEQALFALSELPGNEGLEPLIRLAKTHRDARIRKKAVFWLGESDDPRALEAIISIIKGKQAAQ